MSDVYLIDGQSKTSSLARIRCKNEDKELQTLLLQNPHLLPSKQINPDNPPRWLLIKREMPVPDPASGIDRWSVDFLFIDHLAVPTLVECKRCDDTRSRREVTAQMLEYAANGQHFWSEGELARHAADTAGGSENLARWITENGGGGIDDFFRAAEVNLRESRIRLIFFLEDSPSELRSLVDFLNKQLASTEVLLVEARLYDSPSGRIVVPWLFGYTEEARIAKRASRAEIERQSGEVGKEAYLQVIQPLEEAARTAIQKLLDAFSGEQSDLAYWQFAKQANLYLPTALPTKALMSITRKGDLELAFGNWRLDTSVSGGISPSTVARRLADGLFEILGVKLDPEANIFPKIKLAFWSPHAEKILDLLRKIMEPSTGTTVAVQHTAPT